MIIIDELSFRFVEGKRFQAYSNHFEPKYNIYSHHTVVKDIFITYVLVKDLLNNLLEGQRVFLNINTRASFQKFNYIYLPTHFINSDYNLHKKTLKPFLITIRKVVKSRIRECGLEPILSITVDIMSSNNITLDCLKNKVSKEILSNLAAKSLHVQYCAHTPNLIVTDNLKDVHQSVAKLRN